MLLLAIGLFVVRYKIKKSGVDFLAAIMSLCATMLVLQDSTIPEGKLMIVLMPMVLILFLTFIHLMFSNKSDSY